MVLITDNFYVKFLRKKKKKKVYTKMNFTQKKVVIKFDFKTNDYTYYIQ